jgi:hypothetical protein
MTRLAKLGPATVVTAVCAVGWLGSMAFRAKVPEWPGGAVADTLMTTIVGFFFTQKGAGK